MSKTFWAHSDREGRLPDDPQAQWQRLSAHLVQVGALSQKLAALAKPGDCQFAESARISGLLHDLGKYQPGFQEYLLGNGKSIPHSAHGAAIAYGMNATLSAFAIAGHHAGLPDPQVEPGNLARRIKEAKQSVDEIWPVAIADCPELATCQPQPRGERAGADLHTRMLFSCLVDADRLDSAGVIDYLPFELDHVAERLAALQAELRSKNEALTEGPVKQARLQVLESCLNAASEPSRLLSLTVPTGGGKTLASLAFALKRALTHPDRPRRIIVVIPYLSIIEQNAEVLAGILGPKALLEHHSGEFVRLTPSLNNRNAFVPKEGGEDLEDDAPEYRRGQENWNAPVIVTTAVRFFESLFSNRPSELRRVHNIARSIVILDEVQTLPCEYLQPLLSMIGDLAKNWKTTFLLCTATQPAFEKKTAGDKRDARWEPKTLTEVMSEPRALFDSLRRVEVEWPGSTPTPWVDVAERMISSRRALCIVNVREHASKLHVLLGTDAFHLSTRMCAADRLAVIHSIRERLKDPEAECLVSATQLVEAGVDLDFPVVFRALGPLDSIIQAAGRCDREGKLTLAAGKPGGRMIVFRTEDGKTPPGIYKEATGRSEDYLKEGRISIYDPLLVREYFHRLYGEGRDLGKGVEAARTALQFPAVAKEFDYIANYTQDVYVPYDDNARKLIAQLRAVGFLLPSLRRGLQRYTVGLRPNEVGAALARLERFKLRNTKTEQEVWICREGYYRPGFGILLETHVGEYVQ